MKDMWNPEIYLRYADERGRPFHDLIARIRAADPKKIVDLGCGPGNLTGVILGRWPQAELLGVDSSPEMIAKARDTGVGTYELSDIQDFQPESDVDVIVSNAALQWVPGQEELVVQWARALRPGSWLALQVPGNYDAPSHLLLRQVCASARWKPQLGQLAGERLREPPGARSGGVRRVPDAVGYARLLRSAGCVVDAWETTYIHQLPALPGELHPVLTWMSGTALRPVRQLLSDAEWAEFCSTLSGALESAYPEIDGVVDFPFLRVFAVAERTTVQ